jgi:hypothetical protein
LAQFVQSRIWKFRHQIGQDHQVVFIQFSFRAATVRQRGNIAELALLAQQLINEGFMHAEQAGDMTYGSNTAFDGVNDSFAKV